MAHEPSFSLYESVFRASVNLSRRARGAYLLALAEYYFDGIEPHDLPRDAMNVYRGVEYRILRARSKSREGSDSHADGQREPSEPLPNGYAQPTDTIAGSVADVQDIPSPAQTLRTHTEVNTNEHEAGWGGGSGTGCGVGKANVGFTDENSHHMSSLPPLSCLPFKKKMVVAEEFITDREFNAICTSNDALERWVCKWHKRAWRDKDSRDMDEIVTSQYTDEKMPRWAVMLEAYALAMEERADKGSEWW